MTAPTTIVQRAAGKEHRYTLVSRTETRTGADFCTWRGACTVCSAPFEILTTAAIPRFPVRTCPEHRKRLGPVSDVSVELDAIEPNMLRHIVEGAIQRHLPPHQLRVLQAAEESERGILQGLVRRLRIERSGWVE